MKYFGTEVGFFGMFVRETVDLSPLQWSPMLRFTPVLSLCVAKWDALSRGDTMYNVVNYTILYG